MSAEPEEAGLVRAVTLTLATLATVAAEQALAEPGRPFAVALIRAVVFATAAVGCDAWLGRRGGGGDSRGLFGASLLLALFLAPFAVEAGSLVLTGRARTFELVALAALRNLGLGLAALARGAMFLRLAAPVSLFVILASSSQVEGGVWLAVVLGAYLVTGGLWLILAYWKSFRLTLGPNAAPRRFPVGTLVVALALVGAAAAVAGFGPAPTATLLAGWLPSSGGADWSDPDARSGVNDGDHEVSGADKPQSVGFTDSDVYLDTDRPSLYDAFNDMYGEPFRPKRWGRMIALNNTDVQEQRERPAENLRAGRQFAAVRRRAERAGRRPSEREAEALLYVKGPTPLHLGLAAYDRFDGRSWDEAPFATHPCPLVLEPRGGPWFRLEAVAPPAGFAEVVRHQIKIGLLDSSPLPLPSRLAAFRIGRIDQSDFFGWSHEGMLRMAGRSVPAGSVLETESRPPDPRWLRGVPFPSDRRGGNPLGAAGDGYHLAPAVATLARSWTAGRPYGWEQVEAIVAGLRRHAAHDRSALAPAECDDVVADFLLRSRRGPDYLFATAAAVLLRSSGFPSRVVSGFYAAPERYDPRTRHTAVRREDVHFWTEVRLPSGAWIAVEPTPGYRLLEPPLGLSERIARSLAAALRWTRDHAASLTLAAMLAALGAWRRRETLDGLATLLWWVGSPRSPRRQVARTLRLLERRSRWAGCPRPPGQTPRRWYGLLAAATTPGLRADLETMVGLADWSLYGRSGRGLPPHLSDSDAHTACRRAVRGWTLRRFRSVVRLRSWKELAT